MAGDSDGLWQELSELADAYSELSRGLLQAARRLQAPGALPGVALEREMGRLREATSSVRQRACVRAGELGVPVPEDRFLDNLKAIAALLEVIAEAEERVAARASTIRTAVELLDRVLALRHLHEPDFAPLQACQGQARLVRDHLTALSPVGELDDATLGLCESDHPFAYLMMLVDGVEVVSDDLWEGLFESVGRTFGRALAAAVARAKIVSVEETAVSAEDEGEARLTPAPATVAEATLEPPAPEAAPALALPAEPVASALSLEVVFGAAPEAPARPTLPVDVGSPLASVVEALDTVADEAFSFLPRGLSGLLAARRGAKPARKRTAPRVERLEKVRLLSCNTISGYVFLDANNDGIYQPSETPIAGNPIELRNASDIVVGTAVTDSNGFYSFSTDSTISTAPKTTDQTINIPAQPTNFTNAYSIAQFDPALGELIGVDITVSGTLSSNIKAENMSTSSPDTIVGTVSGTIALSGPGVNVSSSISAPAGTFNAARYDGVLDFAGTSGIDFGTKTAPISKSVSLVKGTDDLSPFVGTGSLNGTFDAKANSGATGGGNLEAISISSANASVHVVYRYIPSNCLAAGSYTIVQTQQPPDTLNGKRSSNSTVYPPPAVGPDRLTVSLADTNLTDNDFGELRPSSLAGVVYYDQNDNGTRDPGEPGIPGTTVTLTGTDDLGAVTRTLVTDGNGAYGFTNLRQGSYQIDETQPATYLDGKDSIGSQGGSVGPDRFYGINLGQGVHGLNNNFGELKPAGLSGHVYWDKNNDGQMQAGEPGIAGTTVTLKGVDSLGTPVSQTTTTDASGSYAFPGLAPGTYELTETQPATYLDGKDSVGTQGGSVADDRFFGIHLGPDAAGVNYNYGELKPSSLTGYVYRDDNDNGAKNPGEAGIPGTTVTLKGTDDLGAGVNLTTLTDSTGAYQFTGLRPGSYRLDETQPSLYLDGKDAVGTQGGTLGNDSITNIALGQDVHGTDNDFGELVPAEINGYVYVDLNKNGVKDAGEPGLPNVTIQLDGKDDEGNAVKSSVATDATGFYDFTKLRPGTYDVSEPTQPAGYDDGQEARHNKDIVSNSTTTDAIKGIVLTPGAVDADDNFGEYKGGTPSPNDCTTRTVPEGVERLGIHHQPTRFVLTFNQGLDPASASNLANYHLMMISRSGKVSRHEIPLKSAVYNAANNTVTLTPAVPLNIHYHYRLTVSGLVDACGNPVDGNRDGVPGGNFVAVLTKANYPHALPSGPHVRSSAWASRFPRLAASLHDASGTGALNPRGRHRHS